MIRKTILVISVLAVGLILFYGLDKMKTSQEPEVDIYSLVDSNAILVIELQQPNKQWNQLTSNNIIWEELQVFEDVSNFNALINSIDSAIINQKNELRIKPKTILFHISKIEENEYISQIHFRLSKKAPQKSVTSFLAKAVNGKISHLSTKESKSFEIKTETNILYGTVLNDVYTISYSPIRNGIGVNSILSNPQFTRVRETSSKNTLLRMFVEPNLLLSAFEKIANQKTILNISLLPQSSSWIELDGEIKPDEISFSGFTLGIDSLNHWISLFKNQEPVKPRMVAYLPDRTALIMHFGFSDFEELRNKYVSRKSKSMGIDFNEYINNWDTEFDISISKDFISWIDNELAFTILEPDQPEFENDMMVWVGSSDSRTLQKSLAEMALKVVNKKGLNFEYLTYKDHEIHQIPIDAFLEYSLGESFKLVTENYFTQINDYIVFANSPATLQWTIDRIGKEKTLLNDSHYQSYTNRISEESNIYLYSNIAASSEIYKSITNQNMRNQIGMYTHWLQKFQVVSLQISYETDNLYFVNNYFKYNPVYKKESNSLWELPLLANATFKPVFVKNHYTQANEIFIQDSTNTIYLIDSKGNILWRRKIDGEIKSTVTQIDALKNNKLQLVFNTQTRLYIIDRNGNNLTNFPITLPSFASAPLSIMDYENSKDYRFLIPTISGGLLNYGVNGRPVTGWQFPKSSIIITQPIKYINLKQKDYLVVCFANGSVKALDRRGNLRLDLKSKFNFQPIGTIALQRGSDLENSSIIAVTKNHEVTQISLSDVKTRLFSINIDSIGFVYFTDIDRDGSIEIIAKGDSTIKAYKIDGNSIFNLKTPSRIDNSLSIYHFKNKNLVGMSSFSENKIYLAHTDGSIVYSFPLKGGSPFSIMDINNDGRYNLITVDKDGLMLNYTLDL